MPAPRFLPLSVRPRFFDGLAPLRARRSAAANASAAFARKPERPFVLSIAAAFAAFARFRAPGRPRAFAAARFRLALLLALLVLAVSYTHLTLPTILLV